MSNISSNIHVSKAVNQLSIVGSFNFR